MSGIDFKERLEPHLIRQTRPDGEIFYSVLEKHLVALTRESGRPLAEIMIGCLDQGIWPERFRPQKGTFSASDQARLLSSSVAVIGAGGLGGSVCLLLARVGVGRLIICDGDSFEESNLNRQLLSNLNHLGHSKVQTAVETIQSINPAVRLVPFPIKAGENNLPEIIGSAQVVVDCLDNMETRYMAAGAARDLGLPFIHGAVAGQEGVIMTIFPGDPGLEALYGPSPARKDQTAEAILGVPTITPAVLGALQASEAVNILLGRPLLARGKLLHLDLSTLCIETCELDQPS